MKSGYISIIGRPNVGKSTLLNLLTNEKTAIVTNKPQTTRNNIIGIVEGNDYQIVFTDTPGYIKEKNKLEKTMTKNIRDASKDVDVLLLIIPANAKINDEYIKPFIGKKIDIIILNKIDLANIIEIENIKKELNNRFPKIPLIEMQAITGFNKDKLLSMVLNKLPEGPKYYPNKDDAKNDFLYIKEMVREKLLINLKDEVPHQTAVYIKEFKNNKDKVFIVGNILINKESQKGIIIGKEAKMLKKITYESRRDLKKYFKKDVILELIVKVKKDWFNKDTILKELGYK